MLLMRKKGRKEGLIVPWIFIIIRFCICKFSYLLKFTCNPKSNTCSTLMVIPGHVHAQNSKKYESPNTLLSS